MPHRRRQAISSRRARLMKRTYKASGLLEQEYSPSVGNDISFEQPPALPFDDSTTPSHLAAVEHYHSPTVASKEEAALFDDCLLSDEEDHTGISEKQIQERMEQVMETVQTGIDTVTPIVTKLSHSTRELLCYRKDKRKDGRSMGHISIMSHNQEGSKNNPIKKDRSFHSNDTSCATITQVVRGGGGYNCACDVFSIMERQMDTMDEECAVLDESATTRSELSNKIHCGGNMMQSSPKDVRHFHHDTTLDSSLETAEFVNDDSDAATIGAATIMPVSITKAMRGSSFSNSHHDGGTVNSRDSTPCRRNNNDPPPPPEPTTASTTTATTTIPPRVASDETNKTNHQHQQIIWQNELHRTIAQARTKQQRLQRSIKRFLGRKLKKI